MVIVERQRDDPMLGTLAAAPVETVVVDALVDAGVRVLLLDNLEDLAGGEDERKGIGHLNAGVPALHPHYERVGRVRFVAKQLQEFREEFAILEQAWLDDGTPAYRFRDPLMRVYIRLRILRDRRAAAAAWTSSLLILPDGSV